jgi:hypothetical protein
MFCISTSRPGQGKRCCLFFCLHSDSDLFFSRIKFIERWTDRHVECEIFAPTVKSLQQTIEMAIDLSDTIRDNVSKRSLPQDSDPSPSPPLIPTLPHTDSSPQQNAQPKAASCAPSKPSQFLPPPIIYYTSPYSPQALNSNPCLEIRTEYVKRNQDSEDVQMDD